jgi:predicted RNA-binding protein with PUA-like domain
MNYWLVKQEPDSYPFSQLIKDKKTLWTGVRNFQARNNLRAMKKGDSVFYYHSVTGKQIVGLATVSKEAFADPTTKEEGWVCVEIEAKKPFTNPIDLETIKNHPKLKNLPLIKQSRLSVMPIPQIEAKILLDLGK